MPVLHSYRNQLIDLHSKSIDWFLYEGNTGINELNVILQGFFNNMWPFCGHQALKGLMIFILQLNSFMMEVSIL